MGRPIKRHNTAILHTLTTNNLKSKHAIPAYPQGEIATKNVSKGKDNNREEVSDAVEKSVHVIGSAADPKQIKPYL